MAHDRLLYTRAAKVRLDQLPVEARVHLETHLENLSLFLEAAPDRLPGMLDRIEDGFVTTVQDVRVLFTVDTSARTLLVHRVEASSPLSRAGDGFATPEADA